jgi:A/G-specific adenine glycosylase
VLVSEVMLQQTPVARVAPVWIDWVARWPTPSAFAAASRADVLRAWGRLGYPRRALRLHDAAAVIAARHGDAVPDDVDALEALPGVGSYTARAVLAFGHGRRAPVVDTNVRRVVARACTAAGTPARPAPPADLRDVDALLPPDDARAAVVSAGLMELGAVVCTARAPRCGACPVVAAAPGRPRAARLRRPAPARCRGFAGTDRQVRGKLLDVLRAADAPVDRAVLDAVWDDAGQRDRCLVSLLEDGPRRAARRRPLRAAGVRAPGRTGRTSAPSAGGGAVPQRVRFRLDADAVAAVRALRVRAGAEPGTPAVTVAAATAIPPPARTVLAAEVRLLILPTLWLATLGTVAGRPTSWCSPRSSTPSCSPCTPPSTTRWPGGSGARSRPTCRAPGCRTACCPPGARPRRSRRCTPWSRCGRACSGRRRVSG